MFGKTREKLEDRYVKPVQQTIAGIAMIAVLAFAMALLALIRSK